VHKNNITKINRAPPSKTFPLNLPENNIGMEETGKGTR